MGQNRGQSESSLGHAQSQAMKVVLCLLGALIGATHAATTVETLVNDPNFSTLVSLVTKAGLVDALNGGDFTIFAPTNAAFAKVLQSIMDTLANDTSALTNVLKYHVAAGTTTAHQLHNDQQARFNNYHHNHVVTMEGAKITETDRMADNGVIHVVDSVMVPPAGDIVALVAGDPNYSTLLSLVQQAGIAAALKGAALTLFAPNNAAFAKLPASVVTQLTSDIPLLTEILQYHVVGSTTYSSGLYDKQHMNTIDKHHDKINVGISATGVQLNGASMVVKADVGTSNGVVHEIDTVLIPPRYADTIVG